MGKNLFTLGKNGVEKCDLWEYFLS